MPEGTVPNLKPGDRVWWESVIPPHQRHYGMYLDKQLVDGEPKYRIRGRNRVVLSLDPTRVHREEVG